MSTQITIDPNVRLPDAYRAEYVKSLVRLESDCIPEETRDWLAYPIEGIARTTEWRFGSLQPPGDLKFRDAFVIAAEYFHTAIVTAPYWDTENVTTSNVIILDNLDFPVRIDWNRWHELLDHIEKDGLSPEESIEYEQMEKVVQALDESEARVAGRALDQLEKQHDRVLASIRRVTDAVVAATRSG